ncbi:MAG: AgmX/PglI C-terminal domain-containing protein [Proteobacteria bacterium]|nr:AgmX/PglI C-terminal domain-containing protein [Pseudomonadota bacterium]
MTMWKYTLGLVLGIVGLSMGIGCGGSVSQTKAADDVAGDEETGGGAECGQDGMEVDGLLGSVAQDEVERVFDRQMSRLLDCYADVVEDIEEVAGAIEIALQVDPAGTVVEAYLPHSDLGSLEAESCILKKIRGFTFARSGCGMAYIKKAVTFEAPYDHGELLQWGRPSVAETLYEHAPDVERCLAGETGVDIVVYVGKGGVVWSSGASAESLQKLQGARCLATAVRSWEFKDPGEDVAKVRLNF